MAIRKYICPSCKYRFLADVEGLEASGAVSVIRGPGKDGERERDRTIDLKCPSCEKEFAVKLEV